MSDCNICVEPFTFRNKKVTCIHCNFEACRTCCKQFMLGSINDAACMECKKPWNREFLCKSFPYSFVDKDYKKYKENLLFEQEKAKLAETQAIIEQREKLNNYREKINKLREEIYQKKQEIRTLENERWAARNGVTSVKADQVKFFGHCPKGDCKGFINASWRCGICTQRVCKSCKEKIGEGEDALKLHACDANTLATLKEIKQDSKPCPKCKAPISKISGCNMMWCTNCNVAFDWRTNEIFIKNIHNPHYFEFMNRTGGTGRGHREQDNCGEQLPYDLYGCCGELNYEVERKLTEIIRIARHFQHFEMPPLNTNTQRDNTLEYRILYMTNVNNEKTFKTKLQRDNKKKQKDTEKYQVMDMFVNTVANYAYELILVRKPGVNINTGRYNYYGARNRRSEFENIKPEKANEFIDLIDKLIKYTNESMKNLRKVYKNRVPMIETDEVKVNGRDTWQYVIKNK